MLLDGEKKCVGEYSLLCIQTPGSTSPRESRIVSSKHPTTASNSASAAVRGSQALLEGVHLCLHVHPPAGEQALPPPALPETQAQIPFSLQCPPPPTRPGLTTKATASSQSSVQQSQCLLEATSPGLELPSCSSPRSFMVLILWI